MTTTSSTSGHWSEIARRWAQVGPPLRPSAEDVAFYAGVVRQVKSPRALILGVTLCAYTGVIQFHGINPG